MIGPDKPLGGRPEPKAHPVLPDRDARLALKDPAEMVRRGVYTFAKRFDSKWHHAGRVVERFGKHGLGVVDQLSMSSLGALGRPGTWAAHLSAGSPDEHPKDLGQR